MLTAYISAARVDREPEHSVELVAGLEKSRAAPSARTMILRCAMLPMKKRSPSGSKAMPSGMSFASVSRNATGGAGVCGSSPASSLRTAWNSVSVQTASKPNAPAGNEPEIATFQAAQLERSLALAQRRGHRLVEDEHSIAGRSFRSAWMRSRLARAAASASSAAFIGSENQRQKSTENRQPDELPSFKVLVGEERNIRSPGMNSSTLKKLPAFHLREKLFAHHLPSFTVKSAPNLCHLHLILQIFLRHIDVEIEPPTPAPWATNRPPTLKL